MTIHKGARVQGGDYFDDFATKGGGGILGGSGQDEYDGVREQLSKDGVEVTMSCRKCGKPRIVTLEWPELFLVGTNGPGQPLLMPPGWSYSQNNGALYPSLRCCATQGDDHGLLCPMVTPDEARKYLNDGVSQGLVPMESVQAWQSKVSRHRGQGG